MSRKFIGLLVVGCLVLIANASATSRPQPGQVVFKIDIPKAHVNSKVVEGNGDDAAVPGALPVHYRSTNLPGEGQTIVISGHHYSHPNPGKVHGVFIELGAVQPGDSMYLSRATGFGHGELRFVVSSNRPVFCGYTKVGFDDCPAALRLMKNFNQTKVYVITCIGDGYWRRVVTAFLATPHQT